MRFLLENREEARRLSQNARDTAQEHFNLPRFLRDWEEAFAAAIDLV